MPELYAFWRRVGPICYGGAAHFARQEDGVKYAVEQKGGK